MVDSNSFELIRELLSPDVVEERQFVWQEISAAIADVTERPSPQAEELLVRLLELEGPIRLSPESHIPSVMLPEEILKCIAVDTLSKWTGRKYLKVFEAIETQSRSRRVSEYARSQIEQLGIESTE